MINLKKILCPVDFSDCSKIALDYSVSLAKKYEAQILILHVVETTFPDPEYIAICEDMEKIHTQLAKQAETKISKLKETLTDENIKTTSIISTGKPFVEIIKCAKKNNVDLIVIGSHGQSGLSHILFGSTADKVIRKSPCGVLTVKHPDHLFEMP